MHTVGIAPLLERARLETGSAEQWTHVQLCWHVRVQNGEFPSRWAIDDVLVTPYGGSLAPAQTIPIQDHVVKDFQLAVSNNGAFSDTYSIRLEDEQGFAVRGPSNWQVDIRDEVGRPIRELRVEPGETRVVKVHVVVDVAPQTLAREGFVDLAITIQSQTLPALKNTQHLGFRYSYPERPNLRVGPPMVDANDAALPVNKPRTVNVIVQNTGTFSVDNVEIQLLDKMDASFGEAPQPLLRVDGTPVPPFSMAPGDVRIITVNWIPTVAGEHNLTVVVDPLDRILENDERDNTVVRPMVIQAAQFPDLVVDASATPLNPSPGDTVDIQLRMRNRGSAPALGVQYSILAGVTDVLPDQPPHLLARSLAPGEEALVNASWVPSFAGVQSIIFRARVIAGTLEPLDKTEDNVQLVTVRVRSRGLEITAPAVEARPDATVDVPLTIRNGGELDDTYALRVTAPDDWNAVFPDGTQQARVSVANHTSASITLRIHAAKYAEAGPYAIEVHARSENGTEHGNASVVVDVPQDFGLGFSADEEAALMPGRAFLPITLTNGGNGPEVAGVIGEAPDGWLVEASTFKVPARGKATVGVPVQIPGTTPEGTYTVDLFAQGKTGTMLRQRVIVQVLAREWLQLRVEGVPEVLLPGQTVQGRLVVLNAGNVHAQATLRLESAWPATLVRDVASLQPGEERSLPLTLTAPANATGMQLSLTAIAQADAGFNVTFPVRAAVADLAVETVDVTPKGAIRDGDLVTVSARIANKGEVNLTSVLAVYVDDALVALQDVPTIAAGADARVTATFRSKGGEHVILAEVDPANVVGEVDEANNARVLVQRVSGGGFFALPGLDPAMLLVACLGLALLGRRKLIDR
jgi:uncharacterized membrane protein